MKSLDIPQEIDDILAAIDDETNPESIFVYGSRARKDAKKDSDYEVGVAYQRDKKVGRSDLAQFHKMDGLNIYPFVYEDMLDGVIDTPFPPRIYLRELVMAGIVLYGRDIMKEIEAPPIRVSDLVETVAFETSYSLSAVLSERKGDIITSSQLFSKSVLFGLRVLVIVERKEFPVSYTDIADWANEMNLPSDYSQLVDHAVQVRWGKRPEVMYLYKNISFQNQYIRPKVHALLKGRNPVVIE